MYDASTAEFVCDFIGLLKHSDGRFAGQPFVLLPWQRDVLLPFYGTLRPDGLRQYQYLYLEIPKKNGKSEVAAALGLYHTFADGEYGGEVYVCAADRENAGIVFGASLGMLESCPALKKRARIVPSQRTIIDKVTGTVYKVMSSEAYSKHGYKPSCVIFDELHAQPNRELWDIMTFGAGSARAQPVWIVLTTAGDDPDRKSIGWEIHEKARKILAARRGEDPEARDNPIWLPVIYGCPEDADIYDEANWFRANPSLGHTIPIDTVRQEAADARDSESVERLFRWLRLNQWIALKAVGWMPLTLFDSTIGGPTRADLHRRKCFLGLDLSSTTDLTA
nr:terminase large subunit [Clostridia bacterium]